MKRPSEAAQEPVFVIVEVGDAKTRYHVHRSLLVEHSGYFKKALNGPWKEAQDGVVILEDVECSTCEGKTFRSMHHSTNEAIVSIFVDWVYSQRLPKNDAAWCDEADEDIGKSQLARTKALVFGDRMLSPVFHKTVRDSLVEHIIEWAVYYRAVIYAFLNLPKDHAILDLFVEVHCREFQDSLDTVGNGELELRASLPHDFLMRVIVRYSQIAKSVLPEGELKPCDYHGHADEEEKKQCQAEVDKD
ncbi:hypothetical protein J4E83_003170 [Alternaria metachromatica]|uniref:uncharacterized protein n=1 Tax=Alternaria metachromatica TaxID=283354 RepID=UPI0020C44E49|nr:uncharacterized protein J4E83_003170 [Alternaria metachromatica]KAI4628617.1 hypothetical protein J4E83_003170 [Alternaria metachromatica]